MQGGWSPRLRLPPITLPLLPHRGQAPRTPNCWGETPQTPDAYFVIYLSIAMTGLLSYSTRYGKLFNECRAKGC